MNRYDVTFTLEDVISPGPIEAAKRAYLQAMRAPVFKVRDKETGEVGFYDLSHINDTAAEVEVTIAKLEGR